MQAEGSSVKGAFLSPFGAWGVAFGFAVGWGAFVMPGASFLPGAGPLGTAIGVVVGAAAMLVFAWNYHVLVRSRPGPGGAFAYAHDVLGPDYGFLVAWSLLLAYLAILWANATALVLLVRFVAGGAFQVGFHYQLAGFDVWLGEAGLCVAAIGAAGALCLAKRAAARVNLGLVLVLSGCVLACFAAAVAKHGGGLASMAPAFAPGTGRGPVRQVLGILGMMPWAFVGFEAISNLSGEFAFDGRRTFRLMAGAIAAAAAAYVALALLPTLAHPDQFSSWPDYLAGAKHLEGIESMPTFAAARRALGGAGVAVLAAAMFAGISTGIVASVLATSRLLRGLAEYRVFPAWIGRLDADGSPRNAILLVVAFSAAVPFFAILLLFSLYRTQQWREKELELAKARAEANNRAKSGFLSNISHDIRTPLNAIIGYTELAEEAGADTATLRGYVAKIRDSGRSLLELITDVLEMSRIESGKVELDPVPMDLCETLGQFRDLFEPQMAFKGVEFRVDCGGVRDRCVMCDKVRLDRMLLNLVGNALKFTPQGGSVAVTCRQTGPGAAPGSAAYELRVKDTGIGMGAEFAARVFEPFERERTSTVSGIQGTGLGMAITKRIAELMHGSIEVASEKGKGTEFTVRLELPIVPEEEAAAARRETRGPAAADFRGKRILLAEDNEANRDIAVRILADAGFDVDCAANGREAVDKVERGGPGRYDLVLMDVNMPVMDGLAAVRAIRALARPGVSDVRIMALSANAFDSDVRAAFEAGVDGHATKPYQRQMLLERISGMIGGGPEGAYTPLVRGQPPRVLFADDSQLNHTVMAMPFRKLRLDGFASVLSGAEALEKLRDPGPKPFDLLITDLQMPGMTGAELVRAIRNDPALAKLPVFVFTADDELNHTYATMGFTGALIKPATAETIKAMLDSITAKPT